MAEAFFYSIAHAHGTGLLCELLNTRDPYDLSAAQIVERLLALGCTPALYQPEHQPFPQFGRTSEVQRDGQTFLVAVTGCGADRYPRGSNGSLSRVTLSPPAARHQ